MVAATRHYNIDIQDVEYLADDSGPMLARLFVPKDTGTFPAVVDAHGGAWCTGDRTGNDPINEEIARRGVVVASLGNYPFNSTRNVLVFVPHHHVGARAGLPAEYNSRTGGASFASLGE